MNRLQVDITRASGEEVDLIVTGMVKGALSDTVWAASKEHPSARVMSLIFAIESGVRLLLTWKHEGMDRVILPLEGRGTLDFSKLGGLRNPREEGWSGHIGILAETEAPTPRYFTIALELSKQRN